MSKLSLPGMVKRAIESYHEEQELLDDMEELSARHNVLNNEFMTLMIALNAARHQSEFSKLIIDRETFDSILPENDVEWATMAELLLQWEEGE